MIIIVNGKPRSGKTFFIFLLAWMRLLRGERVLGNFTIKHPNYGSIEPYDLVKLLVEGRGEERRTLVLQEVYAWLNSHRALSNINDFESTFVFQSGKLNIDIFCDSQLIGRVDSCLKDMADARFEAIKGKDGFRYYALDVRERSCNVRLNRGPVFVPFALAKRVWDNYRTFDQTFPIGLNNLLVAMERTDNKLVNSRVDAQCALLLKNREMLPKRITKVGVEDVLLQLGESGVFAGLVAARLCSKLQTQNIP